MPDASCSNSSKAPGCHRQKVKDGNKEVKTDSIFYFLLLESGYLGGPPLVDVSHGLGVSRTVWSWILVRATERP